MRVVFDTNVLVSALIWPRRIPAMVVAMARHGRLQSVTSATILDELRRVLLEKMRLDPALVESAIEIFIEHSEIVVPKRRIHAVKTDPDDNRILECAVEGKAGVIVTGDHHLLALKSFRDISIMTIRELFDSIHNS